jgi:hypothetical protein
MTDKFETQLLIDLLRRGARLGQIMDVRREEIDGRPQLVIDVKDQETGKVFPWILDRESARELTKMFGPHPLVEEFFGKGEGLQ